MYYIKYSNGSETNAFVETIVRTELLSKEEKAGGFEVESIPAPEIPEGYHAVLRANPSKKTVFYDFFKEAVSPEHRVTIVETENSLLKQENAELKNAQKLMQNALDELIFGGGF